MDLDGMENYQSSIPAGLFAPGAIDPRLPSYIGEIVMLSALLEKDVAAMAWSVQDREQNVYLAQDVTKNIQVCRRRFAYFRDPWQIDAVKSASIFLDDVAHVASERNEIVHRVWSIAVGSEWGGYKGSRAKDQASVEEEGDKGWRYSPERMEAIIEKMVETAERGRAVVALVTSLARLPTPWANGVWPHRLK